MKLREDTRILSHNLKRKMSPHIFTMIYLLLPRNKNCWNARKNGSVWSFPLQEGIHSMSENEKKFLGKWYG